MSNKIKELLDDIHREITDPWFIFLIISIGILRLLLPYPSAPVTAKILWLLVLVIGYSYYNYKKLWLKSKITFGLASGWMLFLFVAYVAASVKEFNIATISIFLTLLDILIYFLIDTAYDLNKSRNIFELVFYYLSFTAIIIVMFGFFYAFATSYKGNFLEVQSNNTTYNNTGTSQGEFLYFSSATYYSTSYGDYFPIGTLMRELTIAEAAVSFIIHIIVLGAVLSRLSKENVQK